MSETRKATADEVAGMAWWNEMSEQQRGITLQLYRATSAAEAWSAHKAALSEQTAVDVKAAHPKARGTVGSDETRPWGNPPKPQP